jgi:hypothetical protein
MNKRNTLAAAIAMSVALSAQEIPDYPMVGEEKVLQPYRVIPHSAKTIAQRKRNKVAGKERAKQRKKK